jgi:hypothetical protein
MSGAAHAFESVPGLRALAARQQGLVDRAQLRSLGVDAHDVAHQVGARRWQTLSDHVVALFTGPVPRPALIWAAALQGGPDGLVGAWTAIEVHGGTRWDRAPRHLIVPRGRKVGPMAGLVVHESRRLDPGLDACPGFRLPVVRPARATIDAASWSARPDHAAALVAAMVQQRVTTADELLAELESAGMIRFRRAVREAIGLAAGGAGSLGEIRIGPILAAAGLPAPRRQTPRYLDGTLRFTDVEVDLPDGSVLVVEVDGRDHDAADRRAADTLRDLDNLVEGRVTVRVTSWALVHRRRQLVARFAAVRAAAEGRAAEARRTPGTPAPAPRPPVSRVVRTSGSQTRPRF